MRGGGIKRRSGFEARIPGYIVTDHGGLVYAGNSSGCARSNPCGGAKDSSAATLSGATQGAAGRPGPREGDVWRELRLLPRLGWGRGRDWPEPAAVGCRAE